jgi:uncharacterized membrane protein YidH (DUF202 family)
MRNIGSIWLWAVGLLVAAVAVWQFYLFVMFKNSQGMLDVQGGKLHLWLAVCAVLVACGCVFAGILRRINKTEEFHITS